MTPTVGRIVHYRVAENVVRPAIIVHVWTAETYPDGETVQIQVILDGTNDRHIDGKPFTLEECERGMAWRTSVHRGPEVGKWDWPPRTN